MAGAIYPSTDRMAAKKHGRDCWGASRIASRRPEQVCATKTSRFRSGQATPSMRACSRVHVSHCSRPSSGGLVPRPRSALAACFTQRASNSSSCRSHETVPWHEIHDRTGHSPYERTRRHAVSARTVGARAGLATQLNADSTLTLRRKYALQLTPAAVALNSP